MIFNAILIVGDYVCSECATLVN